MPAEPFGVHAHAFPAASGPDTLFHQSQGDFRRGIDERPVAAVFPGGTYCADADRRCADHCRIFKVCQNGRHSPEA